MRFGFIGLGRAARLYHLPAVRALPGAEVLGGFDASEEQRAAWLKLTGLATYESVEQLLAREPDIVVVATPPASHADLCVQALEAGAHVICEKPFVTSTEEGDRVLAAAAAAGRHVAVNHQYREKPIFTAVRNAVREETYGRLAFCQLWQLMNLAPWEEQTPWRSSMAHRTLLEGGVHLVDLMLGFYGELPSAVQAAHSAGFHTNANADAVQLVTLEFSGGRLGQITIDRLCRGGTRYMEARADCERASLRASLGGRAVVQLGMKRAERPGVRVDLGLGGIAWAEQGLRRKMLARSPKEQDAVATTALFAKIVPAFQAGVEPPSSGREGREVVAVIEAAYESAQSGERIELGGRLAPAQRE